MCHAILWLAFHHAIRVGKLIVESDERLAVGVETIHRDIHAVVCEMISALLIFCLMINGATINLHFSCREIALEVLHIRSGIPQTPFSKRKEFQRTFLLTMIRECEFLHFAPFLKRHKEKHTCFHTVLRTSDARVVHAMTTFIAVERCLARLPAWVPNCVAILNIEVTTTIVHWHAIVAIARDATELGILEEGIATSSV